jgi:hypothetical protein
MDFAKYPKTADREHAIGQQTSAKLGRSVLGGVSVSDWWHSELGALWMDGRKIWTEDDNYLCGRSTSGVLGHHKIWHECYTPCGSQTVGGICRRSLFCRNPNVCRRDIVRQVSKSL